MNPKTSTEAQVAKGTELSGFSWLAEETGRTDPASQAWSLMHWLMISNKARFMAINQEFDLIADLPLRPEVAQELISSGKARDHRYTPPGSGWVTIELDADEDADRVIELMRSSYERTLAKRSTRAG